jgi:hypothetical protein
MTFDELRAANPELAVSLYALEPGGLVTLEILTPDGGAFTFAAETAAEAIEKAFPDATCPMTGLPCLPGCDRKTCAGMYTPVNQWPDVPVPQFAPAAEPEPNVFD